MLDKTIDASTAALVQVPSPKVYGPPHDRHHRRHRQIRHGQRVAAVRAFKAAEFLNLGVIPSVRIAVVIFSTNPTYIAAAQTIMRVDEGGKLRSRIERGMVSLLAEARRVKGAATLVRDRTRATDRRRPGIVRIL